jgi:hypothetical protein
MGDTADLAANPGETTAPLSEVDTLRLTAGLGCDGDTIAMTGATQPSIEDILLGALPWIPRVRLCNPFLAYDNGNDFVRPFREAAEGTSTRPCILVAEGSIPNENNKSEGYWASFGTDSLTGQPITTCGWIDRLAVKAWAVVATGTCATYGRIHAMEENPTGCMGLPDYLGGVAVQGRNSGGVFARLPGTTGSQDGDDPLSSLYGSRPGPHDPARRWPASHLVVGQHST